MRAEFPFCLIFSEYWTVALSMRVVWKEPVKNLSVTKPSIKWSIKTIETVESIKNTYAARRGKRKSRNGAKSKLGGIPSRVDICERPAIADQKTEIGHWESDTRKSSRSSRYSCGQGREISSSRIGQEQNRIGNQSSHRKTFPRDSLWQKKNLYLWQGQRILWTSRVESEIGSRFLWVLLLTILGRGD